MRNESVVGKLDHHPMAAMVHGVSTGRGAMTGVRPDLPDSGFKPAQDVAVKHFLKPASTALLLSVALATCVFVALAAVGRAETEDPRENPSQRLNAAFARAYMEEGRRELERWSYSRAIRLLTAAISRGADPEAFKWRGRALLLNGALEGSLEDLNYYVGLRPSDPEGREFRGDAELRAGDYSAAGKDYSAALKSVPDSVGALMGRGVACMALERNTRAIQDFEAALRLAPDNPEALYNLALANTMAGRAKTAGRLFRQALSVENDGERRKRIQERIAALPDRPDAALPSTPPFPDDFAQADAPPAKAPLPKSPKKAPPSRGPQRTAPSSQITQAPPEASWQNLSGTWRTAVLGASVVLEMNQVGADLSGVMRVSGLGGPESSYHFAGTVSPDGSVVARHHSGHAFKGKLTEGRRLVGVVTTKTGTEIPVDFSQR